MLAMEVNDNAGSLTPRGVLVSIASRLAPTRDPAQVDVHAKFVNDYRGNQR